MPKRQPRKRGPTFLAYRQARLAEAAAALKHARNERDRLVRQAVAQGASTRAVAAAVGLTHPGVARILARHPAPPAGI